jgi:hypothetical protein
VLTVDFPQPGSRIGAKTTIPFLVSANDGHGFVEAMQVEILPPSESPPMTECWSTLHTKTCRIEYLAPTPTGENDVVTINASAVDSVGNPSTPPPWIFPLAPRPFVTSMSPVAGPASGGTEIVLKGGDFIAGSELLIDRQRIPGAVVTPTEIRGITQRHDPGPALVQVQNGTALSAPRVFDFVAAPSVKLVSPARGPLAGGTWIAVVGNHFRDEETEIKIGDQRLEDPCFVSAGRIEGRVPAGTVVGEVEVTASDPIGGSGTMSRIFTYYDDAEPTPTDPADSGLEPILCPGVE